MLTVGTALLALLLVGCGGSDPKYKQTWAKPYPETTCVDFLPSGTMTDEQRFVMAADFLLTLRRQDDPNAPIPTDADIERFRGLIQDDCVSEIGFPMDERTMPGMASLTYKGTPSIQ